MDDAQAAEWKDQLEEFLKVNEDRGVEGIQSCLSAYKNPINIKSYTPGDQLFEI